MLHTTGKNEHVPRLQPILRASGGEGHLAFEEMDHQLGVRAVHRQHTAGGNADDRQAKRTFLDDRACRAAVVSEELGVEHPIVAREMVDQHVGIEGAVHGGHMAVVTQM